MACTVITILVLRQMVLSPEGSESRWCFGIYSNPQWCCGTPCPPVRPQNDAKSEKSTQKIAKTCCSRSQTNQPLTNIVLYSLCNPKTTSAFSTMSHDSQDLLALVQFYLQGGHLQKQKSLRNWPQPQEMKKTELEVDSHQFGEGILPCCATPSFPFLVPS